MKDKNNENRFLGSYILINSLPFLPENRVVLHYPRLLEHPGNKTNKIDEKE